MQKSIFANLLNTTTRLWTKLLRIFITVSLLGLVLWISPLRSTLDSIRRADLFWIAAAMLLQFAGIWVQVFRWHVLLDESSVSILRLLKIHLIGISASFFLPSSLAGDAARSALLARQKGLLEKSVLSMLAARLLGLAALLTLALTGAFLWSSPLLHFKPNKIALVLAVFCLACIGPAWLSWKRLRRNTAWWHTGSSLKLRMFNSFAYLDDSLRNPLILSKAIILSLLLQGFTLLAGWCLFRSVCTALPVGAAFALLPLVQLGSLAPLSVGGFGVREGMTMALFHGVAGLPRETCLAVMALGYATNVALSLPGILLLSFFRNQKNETVRHPQPQGADADA